MFGQFIHQLGLVAWPLIILSVLALTLILERLVVYLTLPRLSNRCINRILRQSTQAPDEASHTRQRSDWLSQGISLLKAHAGQPRELREEVLSLWLEEKKKKLCAWLKVLTVIAALSPMLGLLGTILGMIAMFSALSVHSGPITPAILSSGLHTALYTTVFGLLIAIPSMALGHLFTFWRQNYMHRLVSGLNHFNLHLEGVVVVGENGQKKTETYKTGTEPTRATTTRNASTPAVSLVSRRQTV